MRAKHAQTDYFILIYGLCRLFFDSFCLFVEDGKFVVHEVDGVVAGTCAEGAKRGRAFSFIATAEFKEDVFEDSLGHGADSEH